MHTRVVDVRDARTHVGASRLPSGQTVESTLTVAGFGTAVVLHARIEELVSPRRDMVRRCIMPLLVSVVLACGGKGQDAAPDATASGGLGGSAGAAGAGGAGAGAPAACPGPLPVS